MNILDHDHRGSHRKNPVTIPEGDALKFLVRPDDHDHQGARSEIMNILDHNPRGLGYALKS